MTKYCFRNPSFPEYAYISLISLELKGDEKITYAFDYLYCDLEERKKEATAIKKELGKEYKLGKAALVLPIKLQSFYPLNKNYWKKPTIFLDKIEKAQQLVKAAKYHKEFFVFVASVGIIKDKEIFSAFTPFPFDADKTLVDNFIKEADFCMDKTAIKGGLYSIEPPFTINLTPLNVPLRRNIIQN